MSADKSGAVVLGKNGMVPDVGLSKLLTVTVLVAGLGVNLLP